MVSPGALNEKRQQHFPAIRHIRKADPLRGKQKTMAGESGKNGAWQGGGQNERCKIEYQGKMIEAPPCRKGP